ncbi:hypothetical protein [Bremerella sp. P1]|uniref:hypothetical protein n=1 Tax=Bremerella sp. P1 TaxID=3026424 RepID=UPI0023674F66|nr:hypothetical protein [Bremerella sp. P1]WDI40726.1 hypothetical protein PSR63_19830 [Bremerella sp. P1]
MSFYEYWCEQYDPQPVGNVELNTEHVAQQSEWVVFFKLIAATLMAVGLFWLPFHFLPLTGWHSVVVAAGIPLIYVGLAFFFVPQANTDNLGWLGGMVDDPFHISDDWNRSLMFFNAVLGPGRFIAGTMLDVACLLGVIKSDPIAMSDEYYRQQMGYSDDYTTANATMTELPSEEEQIANSDMSREEANQERYGLSSARFLLNNDE